MDIKNSIQRRGISCLLEIVIFSVAMFMLVEDKAVSFLAYLILAAIPVWWLRKHIAGKTASGAVAVLSGPLCVLACLALAFFRPIEIEEGGGTAEKPVAGPSEPTSQEEKPGESLESVLAELDGLVGLEEVKREVRKIVNLAKVNEARKAKGLPIPDKTYHMVFTGNPGTGKTTVARIVARAFKALGVAKTGQLVETDRSGLVGRYAGETAVKTAEVINSAIGGILFIDEAYQLAAGDNDDYGKEAIATLLKRMDDDRDNLIVIVAGYTDEMRDFLDANPGLRSRFARTIEFADYSAGELAAIFRSMAKRNDFKLSAELDAKLEDVVAKSTAKRDRTFGNARFVRQMFEDATMRQADRLMEGGGELSGEALSTLEFADLGFGEKKVDTHAPTIEEVYAELDSLVGLAPVKEEIKRLVAMAKANKLRVEAGLEPGVAMSYNFVFTGNPGTGKTTVARILGKAFRALGILERGNFVETDRSGLVAKYEGQTAAKTNKLIDSAMGGILFIDEAYQLNQGEGDQYGKEAVATLLKRMEDARGAMVVIIAGYKDEMDGFMKMNPGLTSRFNRVVEFPDYSASELAAIVRSMAKKANYRLSPDSERWLDAFVSVMTKDRDRHFGNARWARNLFERTLERQALRVTELANPTKEELTTLRMKDFGIKLKNPDESDED